MRLTVEENREALRRYGHIRPAARGAARCSARCPGTTRTCTQELGHRGPHVSHGRLRKVVAVWDGPARGRHTEIRRKRAVAPTVRGDLRRTGFLAAVKGLLGRLVRRPQYSMEEVLLLVFALAMAGFVIDWALRILGLR
jgi:hypothetical protein